MKKLIYFIAALLLVFFLQNNCITEGKFSIEGRVLKQGSNQPIMGLYVYGNPTGSVQTDVNGFFSRAYSFNSASSNLHIKDQDGTSNLGYFGEILIPSSNATISGPSNSPHYNYSNIYLTIIATSTTYITTSTTTTTTL